MGCITAFLTKLDAAVQRRVDAICFFLMRKFDIRKSDIKYACVSLYVISFGTIVFLRTRAASFRNGKEIVVGLIILAFLLYYQHLGHKEDLRAERSPGHLSRSDALLIEYGKWLKLPNLLGLIVYCFWFPGTLTSHAGAAWCATELWDFSLLPILYIAKTPMHPPAEKEREPVVTLRPASGET